MDKQLHILFLSSWYPTSEQPFLGNFVKRHAELIATKHKVTVVNLQSDASVSEIELHTFSSGNLNEVFVRYPSAGNPFSKWINARRAFKVAIRDIKDVDLIHGNLILSKGLQFVWAKRHFQKPLIVTEHASYFRKEISSRWSWKEKMTVTKVLKAADLLTAVSPFLKSEIESLFPEKKIQVLPNVIDPEIFVFKPKATNERKQFIHVSTLDEKTKNVRGILQACKILKEECGTVFNMRIISDEPCEPYLAFVESEKLEDCVSFAGPMQPFEIAHQMQRSDAFVLFSNYETFSIVIAEAWATGTPVISTPVGIAQALDPADGIQVGVNDIQGLKDAMKQFAEHQTSFDAQRIAQKAAAYSPQEVLQTIEKLYIQTLETLGNGKG